MTTSRQLVAWDCAANISFGRHYGFIDQGKDVEDMIAGSAAGLRYFAPVRRARHGYHSPMCCALIFSSSSAHGLMIDTNNGSALHGQVSQIPWLDNWLDKNPVLRIGPRPLVKGFMYTVRLVSEYQRKLADGTLERKSVDSFIDKYHGLKNGHDFVDDNQVIHWLMLNILAGGDSTAGALRPIVYHLGKQPEAQARLQSELDGAQVAVPAQWKDIQHLAYLDAVVREASRANPAVGLMFERQVPAGGFQLPDGRFIPQGTTVGINPTVVTRDVAVFGDHVDDFIPERWLQRPQESDDNFAFRRRRMEEAADLMFGAGSRVCMGKALAKVEMYKLTATLFALFHVR